MDQWSSSYKLHYGAYAINSGAGAGAGASTGASAGAGVAGGAEASVKVSTDRPQSATAAASTTAVKLRSAIDLSYTTAGGANVNAGTGGAGDNSNLGTELDEGDVGLDGGFGGIDTATEGIGNYSNIPANYGRSNNAKVLLTVDDDEMDGKKAPESSTIHTPNLSTTTYNQSGSLTMGQSYATEGRNNSVDTIPLEQMNIGLSTVPNQFCTKTGTGRRREQFSSSLHHSAIASFVLVSQPLSLT